MGQTFSHNLNGSNCHLSGQALISLQVTEDLNADYDTASAVCLAPGGPHAKGSLVQTVEGGTSTGWWHVDDAVSIRSGKRTWRMRCDTGARGHLPLYEYRLRRKGWLAARSTISPGNIGSENFPPRFCPQDAYSAMTTDAFQAVSRGELSWDEYWKVTAGWRPVGGAADVIRTLCGWASLSVSFRCSLPVMAPEYQPVGTTIIAACKEVAGWSGASCYLNRNGTLVVYDWSDTFARPGRSVPMPAAVLDEELHDAIYQANAVCVVGTERFWQATPGTWNPTTRSFEGGGFGYGTRAVEATEYLARAQNERVVEERIEIGDYFITQELARNLARERLSRIALDASLGRWEGPAEGSQAYRPIDYHCFEVSRSLEWTGTFYRYEIEIVGPQAFVSWGDEGWDF